MIFEYQLKDEYLLPIFNNQIGERNEVKMPVQICLDIGASITTFYKSMAIMKLLYPSIVTTNDRITIIDVNGNKKQYPIYKIPRFSLKANFGKVLTIQDLLCLVLEIKIDIIDVLLSGTVFYNTDITIMPRRKDKKVYRLLKIDTFKDNRDILIMNNQLNGPYYAWYNGVK